MFGTALTLRLFFVRQYQAGQILWHSGEAYIFIESIDYGYNTSVLGYPWILFKERVLGGFAGVEFPKDSRAHLTVTEVNSSGAETHSLELANREDGGAGSDPGRLTPLMGHIYGFCPTLIGRSWRSGKLIGNGPDDALCRWDRDHFDKVGPEERAEIGGISRLTTADFHDDRTGWSRRVFGTGLRNADFRADLGTQTELVVKCVAVDKPGTGGIVIDLYRSGAPAQRIWDSKTRWDKVSKKEYNDLFRHQH